MSLAKHAEIAKKCSMETAGQTKMNENEIGMMVVDAAIAVHRELGPGLLESVYEAVLADELAARGLSVARQVLVPIIFKGKQIDDGYRADIVVNDLVVLELKSIEAIRDVHKKQLLTYLKLGGKRLGYLLNFGEAVMKSGIVRIVNGLPEEFSRQVRDERQEARVYLGGIKHDEQKSIGREMEMHLEMRKRLLGELGVLGER
jgi:GxxExxY protein